MDLGLGGAAVAITGGSKGMGRASAERFAGEGARVAVLARGKEALDDTVRSLAELGSPDPVGVQVDVCDRANVEAAFADLGDRWGHLNVLVNAVGPGAGRFEDLDDDDWDSAFDVGLMAAVRSVRAALPLMRAADWGRIVNISAHSIQSQNPMLVAYTASKSALTSFSKNLARSLAGDGILVNTVSPGTIVTATFSERLRPLFETEGRDPADPYDVMRWIGEQFHEAADLGRAGLPDEIAVTVAFLASRVNGYVTGANVNVDGGSDFM
ncbi:MAG TPA: SDR family oxidoreductase [Acidimicrobiales bacterium]|nr:SDR family oxidoreductase [Acidimicrobiales bacterium]